MCRFRYWANAGSLNGRRSESSLGLLALGFSPFVFVFRMLRANVRYKRVIALAFVVPCHLVDRVALRRTIVVEHPGAFRARPTLPIRGFDPDHPSHIHCLCASFPGGLGNSSTASRSRAGCGAEDNRALVRTVACRRTFLATRIGTCSKCVFCLCMMASSLDRHDRNNLPVIRGESLVSLQVNGALRRRALRRGTRDRVISSECFGRGAVSFYVVLL
jgi:hypothetical protein